MNELTRRLYRRNRKAHYSAYGTHRTSAKQALESARIEAETLVRFERAQSAGLVSVEMVPDESPDAWEVYFDGDTYRPECHPGHPGGARAINAERKRVEETAESYGFAGIVGRYRISTDAPWIDCDSVWGFLGNEIPETCGYGVDVMCATLDALTDALRGRCPTCRK